MKTAARENRNPGKTIKGLAIKGGSALFIRHIAAFLINFSGGVALARSLGPEVLGLYFISFSLFTIARQLIDCGLGIHLIRLPREPGEDDIRASYTLQQVMGLAVAALIVFVLSPAAAWWYGKPSLYALVSAAGIGAYFFAFQSIPVARLERELSYGKIGIIEVSEALAFNLASVAGAYLGYGVLGLAVGNVARGIVPAVLAMTVTGSRPSFGAGRVFALASTASPILGSNLAVWLIILAPPLIVGSLAGAEELGFAQLAYSLLGNTMFIATIFQRVSLSSLSRLQDDPENFNKAASQALQLLFIVYVPFTMGIASLSPWWVDLIYGSKWSAMSNVMLVAAVPVTLQAFLAVFLSALYSKGLSSLVLKQNAVHAALYWSVMFISASRLGALSVPVAHLVAMSAGYIFIAGYRKHCGRLELKPLAFGFFSGMVVMIFSWVSARYLNIAVSFALWAGFIAMALVFSVSTRRDLAMVFNNLRGEFR